MRKRLSVPAPSDIPSIGAARVAFGATHTSIPHVPSVPVPLLTRERFAELIGLPLSVLVAQCERGYWPLVKIGKRVFVNVELVRKQALEREFSA